MTRRAFAAAVSSLTAGLAFTNGGGKRLPIRKAVYAGMLLGIAESLRFGIVSTTDMYYFGDDMARAIGLQFGQVAIFSWQGSWWSVLACATDRVDQHRWRWEPKS